MPIKLQNASLAMSAGFAYQFPQDSLPQIIFSGRSNVGKSSLINSLLGRKSLARVSSTPGKTITINFYSIDRSAWFVDLPGYGFAKRNDAKKASFSGVTEEFLLQEGKKRLVLQLIDMKVGPTEDDYLMLDWLESSGTDYIVVATKSDKLNKTAFAEAQRELEKLGCRVIPFSSLTGNGKKEILDTVFDFVG